MNRHMAPIPGLRRGIIKHVALLSAGLALATTLTACTQAALISEPLREGPAASWSLPTEVGRNSLVMVGDIAVWSRERSIHGVSRSTGAAIWQREVPESAYLLTVASGLIVVQDSLNGPLDVIDPTTGVTRWKAGKSQDGFSVYQNAVFSRDCPSESPSANCAITSRDVQDGRTLWTVPSGSSNVENDAIGANPPHAPTAGKYLPGAIGVDDKPWATIETATGKPFPARVHMSGWYRFGIGTMLVDIDHDAPPGDIRCTISVTAINGETGAQNWASEIFSGRRKDGVCQKSLTGQKPGTSEIGSGSRIAAVTEGGRPSVFDLATGKTVWTGDAQGVPIDGNAQSVLVRHYADEGEISLLDFETGKLQWSAPDPGLSGQSASWQTAMTKDLVVVSGKVDDRPYVLVYSRADGHSMGRFPGFFSGAGENWIALTQLSNKSERSLDFIQF